MNFLFLINARKQSLKEIKFGREPKDYWKKTRKEVFLEKTTQRGFLTPGLRRYLNESDYRATVF